MILFTMPFFKSFNQNPVGRYLAPLLTFLLLTSLENFGQAESVFWIYAAKTLVTGLVFIYCFRDHWQELEGHFDWFAVGLGIVVLVIWLLPEILFPQERAITFNPNVFHSAALKTMAISCRLFGAVLIVPLVEETFWRSFLMRYFIKSDFLSVKLGTYTHLSFWLAVLTFTLMHGRWEWGVAAVTGILYGTYLIKTKNLRGCILAHAVTNLGLGIYVLLTGQWKFW